MVHVGRDTGLGITQYFLGNHYRLACIFSLHKISFGFNE